MIDMEPNLKRLVETVKPFDEETAKKLERLENDFHIGLVWLKAANLIKELPIRIFSEVLKELAGGTSFTDAEKREIQKSLSSHLNKINRARTSDKMGPEDKDALNAWESSTLSAQAKLKIEHD